MRHEGFFGGGGRVDVLLGSMCSGVGEVCVLV